MLRGCAPFDSVDPKQVTVVAKYNMVYKINKNEIISKIFSTIGYLVNT